MSRARRFTSRPRRARGLRSSTFSRGASSRRATASSLWRRRSWISSTTKAPRASRRWRRSSRTPAPRRIDPSRSPSWKPLWRARAPPSFFRRPITSARRRFMRRATLQRRRSTARPWPWRATRRPWTRPSGRSPPRGFQAALRRSRPRRPRSDRRRRNCNCSTCALRGKPLRRRPPAWCRIFIFARARWSMRVSRSSRFCRRKTARFVFMCRSPGSRRCDSAGRRK